MSEPQEHKLDIAILGGGFAGVYIAKTLLKQKATKNLRIGVIARENHMVFQPMLPEVAGSSLSPRHVVNPIRRLCRGAEVYRSDVRRIDWENRRVYIDGGDFTRNLFIEFTDLVLALGAVVDLSRVPGMVEHAYLLQNVGDAMKLRAAVISKVEEANLARDPVSRRRLLTFVVVGGGYSGVETAGQIIDLLLNIHKEYRHVRREEMQVFLVHSRQYVLPSLDTSLAEYTAQRLSERGVKMILGERVRSITANQVFLQNGEKIESNTVISTIGNAPHPAIRDLARQIDLPMRKGRPVVKSTGQVEGIDHLWGAGDCVNFPLKGAHEEEMEHCPATAQFASRQGPVVGRNIAALRDGRELEDFSFTGLGELAAIGHHTAVASIKGFKFHGFFAWWLWRSIYLGKLPGFERKLRVMLDWTLELFFPRDINLLSPRYTKKFEQVHLEKGDPLFRGGEPAFSFYMVKEGRVEITDDDGGIIKKIGPGEHFGERALLSDQTWRFNATAAEPTTMVSVSRDVFMQIVEGSGDFGRLLRRTAATYLSSEDIDNLLERMSPDMQEQTARDIMTQPIAMRREMTVKEVLDLLAAHPHSHYPVVDEDDHVTGFLERQDFYQGLKAKGITNSTKLTKFEFEPAAPLPETAKVPEIVERLVRGGVTKACVVDGDERLIGMITMRDLYAPVEQHDAEKAISQGDTPTPEETINKAW